MHPTEDTIIGCLVETFEKYHHIQDSEIDEDYVSNVSKSKKQKRKKQTKFDPREIHNILDVSVVERRGQLDWVSRADILRRVLLVPDGSSERNLNGEWARYLVDRFDHLSLRCSKTEESDQEFDSDFEL